MASPRLVRSGVAAPDCRGLSLLSPAEWTRGGWLAGLLSVGVGRGAARLSPRAHRLSHEPKGERIPGVVQRALRLQFAAAPMFCDAARPPERAEAREKEGVKGERPSEMDAATARASSLCIRAVAAVLASWEKKERGEGALVLSWLLLGGMTCFSRLEKAVIVQVKGCGAAGRKVSGAAGVS